MRFHTCSTTELILLTECWTRTNDHDITSVEFVLLYAFFILSKNTEFHFIIAKYNIAVEILCINRVLSFSTNLKFIKVAVRTLCIKLELNLEYLDSNNFPYFLEE